MTGAAFAYIAVATEEPGAVAAALARGFGLRPVEAARGAGAPVMVLPLPGGAIVLCAPGDPLVGAAATPGLHHIALAADDPAAVADPVDAGPEPAAGLGGRRRVWLPAVEAASGVRVCVTEPIDFGAAPAAPVEGIDHIGVACRDNRAAIALFSGRLGFPVESTQTDIELRTIVERFSSDKYGVVRHARPPEVVGGLRVAFIALGGTDLELLEDLDPGREVEMTHRAPGTTRQDKGAIARFIARRGPGLHHLALRVPDADRALAGLAAAGLRLIDPVGRPGSRRANIGFVHPNSLGGLLLHVVERRAPAADAPAADDCPPAPGVA